MTLHQLHTDTPWWVKALIPLLISAAISLTVAVYMQYNHNDRDIIQRVSALESHHADDTSRLDRIENKLDQLVTWALGK